MFNKSTRKHSSRTRTARLSTISHSIPGPMCVSRGGENPSLPHLLPVDRMTDRRLWKHILPATSFLEYTCIVPKWRLKRIHPNQDIISGISDNRGKDKKQRYNYRPQRSWAKVIFLQACVCPQGGEGCLPQCMLGYPAPPPPSRPPWEQTPPWDQAPPRPGTPPGEQTPLPPPPGKQTATYG